MSSHQHQSQASPVSERTRVRRAPKRAAYDFETIAAILDDGMVCHLGIAVRARSTPCG